MRSSKNMSSLSLESANYSSSSFLEIFLGVSSSAFSEISDSFVSLSSESVLDSCVLSLVYFSPSTISSNPLPKIIAALVESYTCCGDCRQIIVLTFSRQRTYSSNSSEQKIVSS